MKTISHAKTQRRQGKTAQKKLPKTELSLEVAPKRNQGSQCLSPNERRALDALSFVRRINLCSAILENRSVFGRFFLVLPLRLCGFA
jgi:hypothetical protein